MVIKKYSKAVSIGSLTLLKDTLVNYAVDGLVCPHLHITALTMTHMMPS